MNEPIDSYADMLHLPAPRPRNRVPMPRADRAAQFSAFAALTGYHAVIDETARATEARPELSETAKEEIDAALQRLLHHPGSQARICWYTPDARKAGGVCHTATCTIRRVDRSRHELLLEDGRRLPIGDLLRLEASTSDE